METEIKISAKLYQCRNTARRFFNTEFENKIKPYKDLIIKRQKIIKKEVLEVLIECLQLESIKDNGMAMMLFCAAAVEIIESKTI